MAANRAHEKLGWTDKELVCSGGGGGGGGEGGRRGAGEEGGGGEGGERGRGKGGEMKEKKKPRPPRNHQLDINTLPLHPLRPIVD